MTREEFYKLTDILNSEVLGNFMHGGEADELIAMFEEAVEHSNILEQEEPTIPDIVDGHYWEMLGEEPQEPVSEELERASKEWLKPQLDKSYESHGEGKMMELTHFDGYAMLDAIEFGAKWQKLQDMGITNNRAQDVVANLLSSADNPLDAYATEVAFIMLPATLKESYHQTNRDRIGDAVKLGAKWQKEKDDEEKVLTYKHGFEDCKEQMMKNIWKSANGDDLPDIDKEVIVLTQPYPLENSEYAVSFAHRPYKGKYIGKSLTTGNIETFENKTYDKGGWNIPNVKYWLDVELPKEIEI